MSNYEKNSRRALAILATHPNEGDINFCSIDVTVAGQTLCPQGTDDREVLSILMESSEFGFAVSAIEVMAKELRQMQRVWCEAADALTLEAAA
jgi:hypothetical protein